MLSVAPAVAATTGATRGRDRPRPGAAHAHPRPSRRAQLPDIAPTPRTGRAQPLPLATHVPGFAVMQLLAEAPEYPRREPERATTLTAYRARLARRISYSGPVAPVDLRV